MQLAAKLKVVDGSDVLADAIKLLCGAFETAFGALPQMEPSCSHALNPDQHQ